jgi:hypothetical protein
MGTDPKAEILVAYRQQVIGRSKKIIADSKALVDQSHRRIRIAMGHDGHGEGNNHENEAAILSESQPPFSTSQGSQPDH